MPVRKPRYLEHLEIAASELYASWMACLAAGEEWPEELDRCWTLLWRRLGRDEKTRRQIMGGGER